MHTLGGEHSACTASSKPQVQLLMQRAGAKGHVWRVQVFDVPRGRKGQIGGVCVGLIAIVGFVVLVRSGGRAAASKRAARRRREDDAR